MVEHGQHPPVVRQGLRDEPRDASVSGPLCQPVEHDGSEATALPAVGDDERDLSVVRVVEAVEASDAHDLATHRRHDGFSIAVIDVREPVQLG